MRLPAILFALIVIATGACQTSSPATVVPSAGGVPSSMAPAPVVSPGPLESPSPSTPPLAIGENWQELDLPVSDVGDGTNWIGLMEAVTTMDTESVAVGLPVCVPGVGGAEPSHCHASVWTATIAGGWTRAPDQAGLAVGYSPTVGGLQTGMFDVASGPSGSVTVGLADDRASHGLGVAVWRSSDNRAWQRARVEPALFSSRVAAVAVGPHGYVIVGHVIKKGPRARAAAWTSPDGVTWTRAADTADMDVGPCTDTGEEPSCGGMRAVVATASGFVAVGEARTRTAGKAVLPAAWTSIDGLTWKRADIVGDPGEGFLSDVTTGGPGLVAVGSTMDGVGLAATSVDGVQMSVKLTGGVALQVVASTGQTVFALGVPNQDVDPRADLQLWRSDDGIAWHRGTGLPLVPNAASYRSVDLAATPDRIVVVGWAELTGTGGFRNFTYTSPPSQ